MSTSTRPAVAPDTEVTQPRGFIARNRARVAGGLVVASAATIAAVSPASATPTDTDLTDGAGDNFVESLTSYFTDHVMVSALAFTALMIGVGILVTWVKRGAKSK